MRRAGRELLSLALIDARNHTLHLLALYEQALGSSTLVVPRVEGVDPPVWLAGHIGWFSEWWIARNTQRAFGADCPVRPTRLASIEPQADAWWSPNANAYLCDAHAKSGARITLVYEPTETGRVETEGKRQVIGQDGLHTATGMHADAGQAEACVERRSQRG